MVMRDRLDTHILVHARVEVRQGLQVRAVEELEDRLVVQTREGPAFESRYAIGADGANSVVARAAGLRRGKALAGAIEAEVPIPDGVMRHFADAPLFIFGELRMGYLWIFPKANHLSAGIGSLRPERASLKLKLAQVMARYGISLEGVSLHGHPLPVYLRREPVGTARTLLVGDAAGLVDPLTGEGIRPAVKSGRLTARAVLAGRPEGYSAMVHREIGRSYAFGLALSELCYRYPRASFELAVRNPFATRAFVDLISGRVGYAQVLTQLIASLPVHLATEALASLAGRIGGPERAQSVRDALYPSPAMPSTARPGSVRRPPKPGTRPPASPRPARREPASRDGSLGSAAGRRRSPRLM